MDEPFFLNVFTDAVDEDEWRRLNEKAAQIRLQKLMPIGMDVCDPASAAVGMRMEGHVRQVRYWQGQYEDAMKYGILRSEWPQNHTAIN